MAADTDEKPQPKKTAPSPKVNRFTEVSWNIFGAVLLAGFGMSVTAMGEASFFQPGIGSKLTLLGGLIIFGLSAMFAKMTITELGRVMTGMFAEAAAANSAGDEEPDEERAPNKSSARR